HPASLFYDAAPHPAPSPLSLHDALPIYHDVHLQAGSLAARSAGEEVHITKSHHHQGVDELGRGLVVTGRSDLDELPEAIELRDRSEEHTSELQSLRQLVCRLLLEKKNKPVLVPDPDVLHLQVEERIARLRNVVEVELVAEVRRVLRQHAVAEQPEDRRVLLLEPKLELRLELVELVEVAHEPESSLASRVWTAPFPGTSRSGSSSASGSRTKRLSWSLGCGISSSERSIRRSS